MTESERMGRIARRYRLDVCNGAVERIAELEAEKTTLVDPVEWFAKVERLEADLRAVTKSRDDWQRKYMGGREVRRQLEVAVEALEWIASAVPDEAEGVRPLDDLLDRIQGEARATLDRLGGTA